MEDFKFIFWIIAIGIYIFSQISNAIKKARQNAPAKPVPVPKPERQRNTIPTTLQTKKQTDYKSTFNKDFSKPKKSKTSPSVNTVNDVRKGIEEILLNQEQERRRQFYKETHQNQPVGNYETEVELPASIVQDSVFGKDEHLDPYVLKKKTKHPLMIFLSDKNNLRNAFISSEILNKKF